MRTLAVVSALFALTLGVAGCGAGKAYMPGQPGGAKSDVSGADVRATWLAENPETDEAIREAIEEGVFVAGMTVEHRDVISNPDRRSTYGDGFWRSRETGDEVRYQWFVGGERMPFVDGRSRNVCELIFVDGILREVRYC
jgi:hypothetical protein